MVKGWAPAAWHPRLVLPAVACNEGERGGIYESPPGCTEKSDWTWRGIFTLISPGNHAVIPGKSESLMPNATNQRSSISSRRSESRMYRIGPISSRGWLPVSPGPNLFALGAGMIKGRKQVDAGYSWDLKRRKYILWVSFSHHSSPQNVCCDTSRDVEVKLVGERIGSSGLASTTCSACGSLQRRRTSRNLRVPTPPGCTEKSDWTWRGIFTLISPGNRAAIPGK